MKRHMFTHLLVLCLLALSARAQTATAIDELIWSRQYSAATEAIEALKKAPNSDPSDVCYAEGRLASAQGKTSLGVKLLWTAKRENPANAQYAAAFGSALVSHAVALKVGDEDPALYLAAFDAYQAAVNLDPENFEGHFGLAQYYFHAPEIGGGSLLRAREHAAIAVRLNPTVGTSFLKQVEARLGEEENR